jgi:cell wall-associated NlpC family hydrolase
MLRYLKKAALFGIGLVAIICGVPMRSHAQQVAKPRAPRYRPSTSKSNDVYELSQSESSDPHSFLISMGTQIRETELDCSHFVQFLYEQAGLYYGYTPSRVLYEGIKDFKRVMHPRTGDLVVWPGHVGIVVNPNETTFLSALRSGVKTASYESNYWKKRGRPRFLRYVGLQENASRAWATHKTLASGARANSNSE